MWWESEVSSGSGRHRVTCQIGFPVEVLSDVWEELVNRIGVFVCHCGLNIAGSVDVDRVVGEISKYPGVKHAQHYIYNCSDPGQNQVRSAIVEKKLNGVVMANCSPALHERTFRRLVLSEGLNPFHCEIANIREHCSWPHAKEPQVATRKAIAIIKATIEKLRRNLALVPPRLSVTRRVVIIGGGIAGMQAALDIADAGYEAILVERQPYLGGQAAKISGTFLTLEWSPCVMSSRIARVTSHPKIKLHMYSELESVEGFIGNFDVRIRLKARYVDWDKCTGCRKCEDVCPVRVPSEFDRGLARRGAIYIASPDVSPRKAVIDVNSCPRVKVSVLHGGKDGEMPAQENRNTEAACDRCLSVCPVGAINFSQTDKCAEEKVGAVIVATGYDLYAKDLIPEYELDPDILDGLQFERMLSPNGPTKGIPRRPSDGRIPKEIVFVKCVGSRDPEHGVPYCSRVCCMYTAKQALYYKRKIPDGQAYIFYMDVRSTGKGYEEFVQKAIEEGELLYIRGRVSKIFRDGDKLILWGTDTLTGKSIEVPTDMVVLATAIIPSEGTKELARKLNILTDASGFVSEAHIKLRPVETLTAGIFLGGATQGPKDIPDTTLQAGGAAAKVVSLFTREALERDPATAIVDEEVCAGCGYCEQICTYRAVTIDHIRKISRVNEAICEGCGACAAACPSGAMQLKNMNKRQIFEMIDVMVQGY